MPQRQRARQIHGQVPSQVHGALHRRYRYVTHTTGLFGTPRCMSETHFFGILGKLRDGRCARFATALEPKKLKVHSMRIVVLYRSSVNIDLVSLV